MISRISDVNFCPTELSKQNLISERAFGNCHVVGNTVLDNLLQFKKEEEYSNIVLVTMHRRENHSTIKSWFKEINKAAQIHSDLQFYIPLHPNPNVYRHRDLLTNLSVIEPLSHNKFMQFLTKSRFIITDSGGIQEEGSFFNKKVIVCRKTTERPEGIGTGQSSADIGAGDSSIKIYEYINTIYKEISYLCYETSSKWAPKHSGIEVIMYREVSSVQLRDQKYDLVLVDGPTGVTRKLWYKKLKSVVKKGTIVHIDDYDHYKEFEQELKNNLSYEELYRKSRKVKGEKSWLTVKIK